MITIVDTMGKIIRQGDEGGLIVAAQDGTLVLEVDEVSDDRTINFFLRTIDSKSDIHSVEEMPGTYEILTDSSPCSADSKPR